MKADKRKKMLLLRAKRLFARRGYYQTQISDIVKDANVARGTLYQYFKNKDDIFITLLENAYDEWHTSAEKEMGTVDVRAMPPREYVEFRLRNTLAFYAKDPDMTNIMLRMGVGLPRALVTVIDRLDKEIIDEISAEIGWAMKRGLVRKDVDIELAANLFYGVIMRVAYYYFVKKKTRNKPEEMDALVDEVMDMCAPGLLIEPL